jgi:hypothetical protein
VADPPAYAEREGDADHHDVIVNEAGDASAGQHVETGRSANRSRGRNLDHTVDVDLLLDRHLHHLLLHGHEHDAAVLSRSLLRVHDGQPFAVRREADLPASTPRDRRWRCAHPGAQHAPPRIALGPVAPAGQAASGGAIAVPTRAPSRVDPA